MAHLRWQVKGTSHKHIDHDAEKSSSTSGSEGTVDWSVQTQAASLPCNSETPANKCESPLRKICLQDIFGCLHV